MIRINLLPVRAAKKKEQGRVQLAVGVLVLAAALGGNWYWYQSASSHLAKARADVRDTQKKIKELEQIIGEVKDIQKRQEDLQKKLDIIAKLRKQKTGPVKMMDSLATILPKEVWLDDFSEKQGTFKLQGEALSLTDVGRFLSALKGSPYFKEVKLQKSDLVKSGKVEHEVVKFILTGKVEYAA